MGNSDRNHCGLDAVTGERMLKSAAVCRLAEMPRGNTTQRTEVIIRISLLHCEALVPKVVEGKFRFVRKRLKPF